MLTEFIQSLDDKELQASDPWYVPGLLEAMVDEDPIKKLAFFIQSSQGAQIYLYSGMVGTGKTTQLFRLQEMLQNQKQLTLYVDMGGYTNLSTPIGIVDLLMAVAGAFSEKVAELLDGKNVVIENYFERARTFLNSNIKIDGINFGIDIPGGRVGANIKLELASNPAFKRKLQTAMEGTVGKFVKDVRQYIGTVSAQVNEALGKPAGTPIVILLDSLERLHGDSAKDEITTSVVKLFRDYLDDLRIPGLKIVYSVSPYLRHLAPEVFGNAGTHVCTIATLPVYEKDGHTPRQIAIDQMVKLVTQRYRSWNIVIGEPQLTKLILASGGDLREFLLLMRTLIVDVAVDYAITLPAGDAEINRAMTSIARNRLPLRDGARTRLNHIFTEHQPNDDYDGFVYDLKVKSILMYLNGKEWYGVHPLLWGEMEKAATAT